MTMPVILAGLIPLMLGHGASHEAMSRLGAPMVGGILTAPLLSLFVIPAAWRFLQQHKLCQANRHAETYPASQTQPEGVEA